MFSWCLCRLQSAYIRQALANSVEIEEHGKTQNVLALVEKFPGAMDAFYKSFGLPPFPNDSSPSSAPQLGGRRRQRRRGAGVKLSTDPQSVAARERRHRISHRFKILQSLVPGGSKMDTVSMLEEAINYVKFLQAQISLHNSIMSTSSSNDDSTFVSPSSHAAGAVRLPTSSSLASSSYGEAMITGISSSTTESHLLPLQEASFGYPLSTVLFPPLPDRPAYTLQEADDQLLGTGWFAADCWTSNS